MSELMREIDRRIEKMHKQAPELEALKQRILHDQKQK